MSAPAAPSRPSPESETIPEAPLIYLVCMNVAAEFLPTYQDWYLRRHAPDTIGIGFHSARAFWADTGRQRIWDMYEIEDAGIFSTSVYTDMHAADPALQDAFANITDRSVTIYEQLASFGPDGPSELGANSIAAGAMLAARLADPAGVGDAKEVLRAVAGEYAAADGIAGVRLARHHGVQHPAASTIEPAWLLLAECRAGLADEMATALRDDLAGQLAAVGADPATTLVTGLSRWYGLLREAAT